MRREKRNWQLARSFRELPCSGSTLQGVEGGDGHPSHEPQNRSLDFQRLAILRFMATEQVKKEQDTLHEPSEVPPGFGVRQPSGAFATACRGGRYAQEPGGVRWESGRGLPHSKTLARPRLPSHAHGPSSRQILEVFPSHEPPPRERGTRSNACDCLGYIDFGPPREGSEPLPEGESTGDGKLNQSHVEGAKTGHCLDMLSNEASCVRKTTRTQPRQSAHLSTSAAVFHPAGLDWPAPWVQNLGSARLFPPYWPTRPSSAVRDNGSSRGWPPFRASLPLDRARS
jgi:hypothetical protein